MHTSHLLNPEHHLSTLTGLILFLLIILPGPVLQYFRVKFKLPVLGMWLKFFATLELTVAIYIAYTYFPEIHLLSMRGWHVAAILFVILMVSQFFIVIPRLNTTMTPIYFLTKLIFFLVLIGYTEELLFRGIWFAMFPDSFLVSVLAGSIIFGLIHWPHTGWLGAVTVTVIGFLFAIARFKGASILPLAIVHGLMDFICLDLLPGKKLRFSRQSSQN